MKTPIYTGIFQSDLDASGYKLIGLHAPVASTDAANKAYVDAHAGGGGGTDRKFDVMTYGAAGDGTTDDTTSIETALAAIPSTGGVLYFPAGRYKYAGATLTLDRSITVEGDGGGAQFIDQGLGISTIDFNSSTGTLFTGTAHACGFKNLVLRNTSVTTPSAGAGILVSAGGDFNKYEGITVDGFYTDIDVQSGSGAAYDGCTFVSPVLYGLKLRNIAVPDAGGHGIVNCTFMGLATSRPATSAIRIESGGGIRIVNSSIVANASSPFVNGIDLAVANGVVTTDLLISNCTIESCSGSGIKGTTGSGSIWTSIVITGNEIAPYMVGNQYAINLSATNSGDFSGLTLTGNLCYSIAGSSFPAISLNNCLNVSHAGNVQSGFSDLIVATASTFGPVYIGTDLRLVAMDGGGKLQARNRSANTWADVDQWTNP